MPSCSSLVVRLSSEYVYMSDYSSQEYCYDAKIVSGNGVVCVATKGCAIRQLLSSSSFPLAVPVIWGRRFGC